MNEIEISKNKKSKKKKILYLDCFNGISGDMFIGAMIDLGVDEKYLRDELHKLNLDEFALDIYRDKRCGISGVKFNVNVFKNDTAYEHDHDHEYEHEHNHEHNHDHNHDHSHGEHHSTGNAIKHSHYGRNLEDIYTILNESGIDDKIIDTAKKIFLEIGEAVAKVHGVGIKEIHFHEVGAVDSIVDVVGAAICYHYISPDEVWAGDIALGSGFVRCDHGIMPVPAPATAEILAGVPVKPGIVQAELTTPTGAAILKVLVKRYSRMPNSKISRIGYGLGTREFEVPNVLRVMNCEVKKVKK